MVHETVLYRAWGQGGPEWLKRQSEWERGDKRPTGVPSALALPSGFSGNWDQLSFGTEAPESWLLEVFTGGSPAPWVSDWDGWFQLPCTLC